MTAPLRPFLHNAQIVREARRIAHAATRRCAHARADSDHDWHTPACNRLTAEIVTLAMQVKLAATQQPGPRPRRRVRTLAGGVLDAAAGGDGYAGA